jgi:hypothetical protein
VLAKDLHDAVALAQEHGVDLPGAALVAGMGDLLYRVDRARGG